MPWNTRMRVFFCMPNLSMRQTHTFKVCKTMIQSRIHNQRHNKITVSKITRHNTRYTPSRKEWKEETNLTQARSLPKYQCRSIRERNVTSSCITGVARQLIQLIARSYLKPLSLSLSLSLIFFIFCSRYMKQVIKRRIPGFPGISQISREWKKAHLWPGSRDLGIPGRKPYSP